MVDSGLAPLLPRGRSVDAHSPFISGLLAEARVDGRFRTRSAPPSRALGRCSLAFISAPVDGRLVLTGLAVVVATVFAAGTLLFSETLRGYVTGLTEQTPAGAALVVTPGGADLLGRLASVDGVAAVTPVSTAYVTAGTGSRWVVVADPMGGPLTRLSDPPQLGRLPAGPSEVAIGAATAARTGTAPGRTLNLTAADGTARVVTVTGTVALQLEDTDTLLAPPALVLGLGGTTDQIDVAAAPGADPVALAARIADAAGPAGRVSTGAQARAAEVAAVSESVNAVLLGVGTFAGLAVVAAGVVVASTFRIVLTQRRTQLALLRCVGARRGQVIRAVLAEAVVTGLVAGLLGLGIAALTGYGVLAALRLGGAPNVPDLVLWWPGLAGVLAVAVLTTVLAALLPALAAARIPPVAALGSAAAAEAGSPHPVRRLAAAVVLTAGAAVSAGLAVVSVERDELAIVVLAASGMVGFAALVAAGPILVSGLVATVGRIVAAVGGAPGRLAAANAGQVPRRTATTVAVLTLGVGLTSALLVALASVEAHAQAGIAARFPADIVVEAPDPAAATALGTTLAGDPRVAVTVAGPTVLVDPAPGRADADTRAAVAEAVADGTTAVVRYAADARAELESGIGTARLLGLGLIGMTGLVAVVGVGVTMMLSITERTRETGLLRALGLTRRGVGAMVAWEAAVSGAGAAVVGAVIGALYGVLGVRVLGVGVGLTPGSVPTLAVLVMGVVLIAVLTAVIPAVSAGRVPPIRALQEDG